MDNHIISIEQMQADRSSKIIQSVTQTLKCLLDGTTTDQLGQIEFDGADPKEVGALLDVVKELSTKLGNGVGAIELLSKGEFRQCPTVDGPLMKPIKKTKHWMAMLNNEMLAILNDQRTATTTKSLGDFTHTLSLLKRRMEDYKSRVASMELIKAKYETTVPALSDVICHIDLHSLKIVEANPAIEKLWGIKVEDIFNVHFSNLIDDACKDRLLRWIDAANAHAPCYSSAYLGIDEFQIRPKNRELISIEANMSVIFDNNGNPKELLAITRDITERKKIENALQESQADLQRLLARQTMNHRILANQLKYIYNNSANAIAFFDFEGDNIRFANCNARWSNALGFKPDELKGKEIECINEPETVAMYRGKIKLLVERRTTIQESIKWRGMDLHTTIVPIADHPGDQRSHCAVMVYNITEQLEAKLKASESEAKFANIFNYSTDPIILMDRNLSIINANKRFYELSGLSDNDIKNKESNILNFIPTRYHETLLQRRDRVIKGIPQGTIECQGIMHNKGIIPIEISSISYTHNGEPVILAIIHDLSERKRYERQLIEISNQVETMERRRLAADLHDNVGPLLSSMNMYLSLLARKQEITPVIDKVENIQRILKESIASVREISNNINPQILTKYGLIAALELFFETKQQLIDITISGNLGTFRFDQTKETMTYNIIKEAFNNTLKYAQATRIDLAIEKVGSAIFVAYKDNGIGFDYDEKINAANLNLGLLSIKNRINTMDGEYTIGTKPGEGFVLEFSFLHQNL